MRLYFDSSTLIHVVEGSQDLRQRFVALSAAASKFGVSITTSELSLAEVLVKPLQNHDFNLIVAYNNLLAGRGLGQIETMPISRDVLGVAAKVRVQKASVKLPDAIHIATAEIMNCDAIITGDKRWNGATTIRLDDFNSFDLLAFIEMFS